MGKPVLEGKHFWMGDIACAEAAIAAGCRFFSAYPITPATEIAERMAIRLPRVGGSFIQFEDELAASAAVVGASYAGAKAMTATSGPGFSLMTENISLAAMVEAPCVIVNIMRAGPSTGQPTRAGQGDVMQAKWGGHGDYEPIALAPNCVQEMFDLTIEAFNLAEQYRVPTFILADEILGHMSEICVVPPEEKIPIINRKKPKISPEEYLPFRPDPTDLVPPMACFGEGYHFYATGLTHDERGYPDMSHDMQLDLVNRLCNKIRYNSDKIAKTEFILAEDAEVIVVAYGTPSRSATRAVQIARDNGIKAGLIRPITLWPFPEQDIKSSSDHARYFLVTEMNYGQILREVERAVRPTPVSFIGRPSRPLTPQEIYAHIRRVNKQI